MSLYFTIVHLEQWLRMAKVILGERVIDLTVIFLITDFFSMIRLMKQSSLIYYISRPSFESGIMDFKCMIQEINFQYINTDVNIFDRNIDIKGFSTRVEKMNYRCASSR